MRVHSPRRRVDALKGYRKLRGNAILIESKDEIRKRLGTSTDDADAVVLAWHKRDETLRRQTRARPLNPEIALGGRGEWMAN